MSYNMNITIGTPPQNVAVSFDTGSSDLVLNSPGTDLCQSGDCPFGSFDASSSASLKTINDNMEVQYTIGSLVGQWATDTVGIHGVELDKFALGVGDKSSTQIQNVLGVGFPGALIEGTKFGDPVNQTTPGAMAKSGAINSAAFSVYLRDQSKADGAVIFGGIDHAHFNGELTTYPMVPNRNGVYDRLSFNVSGVGLGGTNATSTMRTMIDTGEPDLRLPSAFVRSIWEQHHVTGLPIGDPRQGVSWGLIDCSMADSPLTVDILLPGLEISIPFSDIVLKPTSELIAVFGKQPSDIPKDTCLFNLNDAGSDPDVYILGIPFFQSAYTVFNLDTKEISIAPLNKNPGSSDLVAISKTTVPSPSSTGPAPSATSTGSASGLQMPLFTGALLSLVSIVMAMQ